jgi:hypothetical protein
VIVFTVLTTMKINSNPPLHAYATPASCAFSSGVAADDSCTLQICLLPPYSPIGLRSQTFRRTTIVPSFGRSNLAVGRQLDPLAEEGATWSTLMVVFHQLNSSDVQFVAHNTLSQVTCNFVQRTDEVY